MKPRVGQNASTIVPTVLFITIFTWAVGSYMTVVSSSSLGTYKIGDQSKAFYAAEAGAYRMLHELNSGGGSSVSGTLATGTYSGSYSAAYSDVNSQITSIGTVGGLSRTVSVRTRAIPNGVGGAVTVNSSVTTSGNIVIDGREYDQNGNLTGDPGVVGISAAGIVTQSGSSLIGGAGIAPSSPALAGSLEESVNPFPSTAPWDILGVSEAWFNANIPVQTTPPPENFSGIYYYEPPGSGIWNSVELGNSSGILIVHNSTNTATMKNIHGTFKGLIISDQVVHVNGEAEIYGALVTTNAVGNALGNGDCLIGYSSEILNNLGVLLGGQTSGWKKVIEAGSWKEQ